MLGCPPVCLGEPTHCAMPGRVRRRRGPSANVPKEDGTAVVVKQRVVHTYSQVNPRQTVNKHHFLTPDTPGILEEWELPSHLLMGSLDSSQLLSSMSAQASHSNGSERTEKEQQADPGPAKDGTCTAAKRQKLQVNSMASEETNSPAKSRKVKQKGKKAAVKRGRRQKKDSTTCASTNINPSADSQVQCVRSTHQQNEADQNTNTDAVKCLELEQGSGREYCHQTPSRSTVINGEGSDCNVQLQLQSAEDKMDGSSCDLNLVSMELTCQTVVGPGVGGRQSMQQPLPLADGTGVLLTTRYCDTTCSSTCLDSTSRKVRYFLDTIAADLKHTIGDLPHILTPLSTSAQSDIAGGSSKELIDQTETPTITTEPDTQCHSSTSSGTAQQEGKSEDEIEVPRTRDPCVEFDDVRIAERYPTEKVSLEFSMSDHQLTGREDRTLLECIADIELEGQLYNCGGEAVSQQSLSEDNKKTEQRLPKSAQGRGVGAASGKNSTSCNSLEEHFSSLRMTPIVGLLSPHLPTTPGSKAMAPLTSTPLAALGPGSNRTPRSLHGVVNLECTRDFNQHTSTTPFFNQGHTAYPITSTPLHTSHYATSRQGNVRKEGTPSGSSVGTTMEKMLEFDEVGFDVSEVLDFGSPDKRTDTQQKDFGTPVRRTQQQDFGFSQIFSSSDTESQFGSSGKQHGQQKQPGRNGSSNVDRKEETKCKLPLIARNNQGRNTKPGVPRRESGVQNKIKNFTSKPAAKSKSVVVPKESERQSVKMTTGKKRQSANFTSKPATKSKSVVVPKRQSVKMTTGKKRQSANFTPKPAVSVVVPKGTEERHSVNGKRRSTTVPKSPRKQNRNRLPPETPSLRGSSHDATITDMDSCPLCVLTQVSMEAACEPHMNPPAYTGESAPEDILTQH